MQLNVFNTGLNTRLAQHLLQPSESVVCENVDLTSGSIKPAIGLLVTNNSISVNNNTFLEFKGTWIEKPTGSTFIEFNDKLYIADGNKLQKTSDGILFYDVGITKPNTKLVTTTPSFNVTFTFSNNDTGDSITFATGVYEYLIQYTTKSGAIDYKEQSFNYTGTKGIKLTVSDMTNLSSVILYRKYNTKYKAIGELTTETVLLDTTYNINTMPTGTPYKELLSTRQYVYTYYSTITGFESAPSEASNELECYLNNVVVTNFTGTTDTTVDTIKLYRLGGTLTDFYLVDTLNINATTYTDTKSDLQVLDNSTLLVTKGHSKPPVGLNYLALHNNTLFGSVGSTLYFSVSGTIDIWSDLNYIDMPEHITGLGSTQNGLLIFSRNKTWLLTGENLSNIVVQLLNGNQGCISHYTIKYIENNLLWQSLDGICTSLGGNIEILSWKALGKVTYNPIGSEVYDNQYFLFHTTGTLIIDFREGVRFSTSNLIARGSYYSSSYDTLYILKPSDILMYKYGKGTNLTYKYKTGYLTEGKITNYKTYKELYVHNIGSNSIKIYIDGTKIVDRALNEGLDTIRLPQGTTRGYYIELEFEGTGTIQEIDYFVEGRQK